MRGVLWRGVLSALNTPRPRRIPWSVKAKMTLGLFMCGDGSYRCLGYKRRKGESATEIALDLATIREWA